MSRVRVWAEENATPEPVIVWQSDYAAPVRWEFGRYFDLTDWGIGVLCGRDYGYQSYPDRFDVSVRLGPWTIFAVRTWNERTP